MKVPTILYKYRSWSDEFHKEIITEQIVFMSPPTSFEDKMDCKLLKSFDLLTDEDIYNKYFNDSKKTNHNYTLEQHKIFAKGMFEGSNMLDKAYIKIKQENHFIEFDKKFGVFCLTENNKNMKMWQKYSDNHSGFCVGFNTVNLFNHLGGGGKVKYYDKLPNILPFDTFEIEHFKQVFSKEKKYKFEEEYRTHKFYSNPAKIIDRKLKITKDCFSKIIFGAKITKKNKMEIIDVCNSEKLLVDFYQSKIKNNKLFIEKIEFN